MVLDLFHDGLEVDIGSVVVDGVIQYLLVHAGELSELIGTEYRDHLAEVATADVLVEAPDAVPVDAEHVQIEDTRQAATERVGVDLVAVLQQLHADGTCAGVPVAHSHHHLLRRHFRRDSLVSHVSLLLVCGEN